MTTNSTAQNITLSQQELIAIVEQAISMHEEKKEKPRHLDLARSRVRPVELEKRFYDESLKSLYKLFYTSHLEAAATSIFSWVTMYIVIQHTTVTLSVVGLITYVGVIICNDKLQVTSCNLQQ